MIVGERKQHYLDFFNQILGADRELHEVKMISEVDENDQPLVVVIFSKFNGANMELAIASKAGWSASRRFLRECFFYAFVTCGAWRVTAVIDERNTKAIEFNQRIGMKKEFDAPLKHFFGEFDGYLLFMPKSECKWIRGRS